MRNGVLRLFVMVNFAQRSVYFLLEFLISMSVNFLFFSKSNFLKVFYSNKLNKNLNTFEYSVLHNYSVV